MTYHLMSQHDNLVECLSSDKRPLGFLLGAGCPMAVQVNGSPIIPDIAGVTARAYDAVHGNAATSGSIEQVFQQCEADYGRTPTVEDALSHIRALLLVAGHERVRGLTFDELTTLDAAICSQIEQLVRVDLPTANTAYHRFATWIGGVDRVKPIEIFTTNYDLLVEEALEAQRVPYFDGFPGGVSPSFDASAVEDNDLPSHWVRLWKLHGSVNWRQTAEGRVVRGGSLEQGTRYVIYPSHLKYDESRKMPYLAMLDRLKGFLKQPDAVLITCGYSFGDQHINDVIVQQLQRTNGAAAFALIYGELEENASAVSCALSRPNLTVAARDGAVIGGRKGDWETEDSVEAFTLGNFAEFTQLLSELVGMKEASR